MITRYTTQRGETMTTMDQFFTDTPSEVTSSLKLIDAATQSARGRLGFTSWKRLITMMIGLGYKDAVIVNILRSDWPVYVVDNSEYEWGSVPPLRFIQYLHRRSALEPQTLIDSFGGSI